MTREELIDAVLDAMNDATDRQDAYERVQAIFNAYGPDTQAWRAADALLRLSPRGDDAWRQAVQAHLEDPMLDPWTRAHLEQCLAARGLKP